jgi:hypothetical protein
MFYLSAQPGKEPTMHTFTLTVRKNLDVVYAPSGRPGLGDMLGMIERSRFNGGTRYTPLNMDMDPLADPQLSSDSAVAILIQKHAA